MFKNACIYSLSKDLDINRQNLQGKIQGQEFLPCGNHDKKKVGWTAPIEPDGMELFYESRDNFLLCYEEEEKVIPKDTLQKELKVKIAKLESNGTKVNGKQKATLKEEIERELLPRAFTKNKSTYLWINLKDKLIFVDTSSQKKADDVLSFLRKSLGSLPVVAFSVANNNVSSVFHNWVVDNDVPNFFSLGGDSELSPNHEHGGVIKTKEQDLQTEEIVSMLRADKYISRVSLSWKDKVTFTIDENFVFRNMKFGKEIFKVNDELENKNAIKMANYELVFGEVMEFFKPLVAAFDK